MCYLMTIRRATNHITEAQKGKSSTKEKTLLYNRKRRKRNYEVLRKMWKSDG